MQASIKPDASENNSLDVLFFSLPCYFFPLFYTTARPAVQIFVNDTLSVVPY